MSSSTSPSIAPSVEYAESRFPAFHTKTTIFLAQSAISNLDPTDFIIGETNRIPFRLANPNLGHWKNTFKSWPSLEKPTPDKSWTTWYQRVSASKKVHWDEIGIGQALTLTIANSAKDEPLMAAATYFWSNTINAFLFNQGPMTPTLIDITMITGLDVTSSANPMSMNTKNQFDFKTKSIGDWSGYVAAYMGQGSVTPREHVAFLLMWLEKFLFYGSSCGPTTNWQFVTEALESKKEFPLGKILLGYLYQMLNNASAKIAVGSIVGAGGPWWLLQTWLNLVVMKVVNRPSVTEAEFPLPEPIVEDDGEERTHRRCMSYGEYASTPTDAGAKLSAELLKDWFCSFYEGFKKDARIWFPYEDSADLELPSDFRFEDINHEKNPKIQRNSYSCNQPMHPPYRHSPRKKHPSLLRVLSPNELGQTTWIGPTPNRLILCRQDSTTESSPPHQSNSGKNIEYASGLIPNGGGLSPPFIGYHAPKTSTLLHGLTREPADAGKKRKTRSSAMSTLALAPKKKTKFKKTQPQPTDMSTDDLPALDPSIEQALDDEEIGEDVDQAVAEMSDTERTPSASPKQTPPTPYAPVHFTRQSSSDQTPSAVGSHHIEEEEQPAAPAIPALADLFSFDIRDYLDEAEEDTSSKALAPLSDDVRKTLEDISHRLAASSLDSLVVDRGSIRTRLYEVQALIPEDLADVLTLAAYLEQHQFKLEKAKLRLAERRDRKEIKATIQTNRQLVHEEKTKLDQLSEGLIKSNIDRLEARKIELLAQLEECNAELDIEHKKLADLPKSIEEQKARLKSAIKNVADLTKSLKVISGTDAQDAQAIEEVEQIRQRAILAIQRYLSQ
ncbi:aminotransferase-like protein [Oryza sativa Japonica Group]|uniref:Aminotransferase-like protein n=1 Tax=Oryza sativa subsp. japonica TaxID=39947 RepID=Q5JMY0_ORYSJ|nr:aminotransferase-like protein [Oryza sativa Japonica Group]BAD87178.1 aminotransferase-like protein [Oryza sativa Japonica Group]